jgi:hypothetical protein
MSNIINLLKSSSPKYSIVQPSTGKLLSYRPFNVKEEKSLLVAKNTGSYTDFLLTISSIVDSCFDTTIESKKLPVFDVEFMFLKLREKSVSEVVNISFTCPETNEKIKNVEVSLTDIVVKKNQSSNSIKISPDIIINMRHPTYEFLIENSATSDTGNIDLFDMVLYSIESIQTTSELLTNEMLTKDFLNEFIENLTRQQYQMILDFFVSAPKIEHEVKYNTSDNVQRSIVLRGIKDFFH